MGVLAFCEDGKPLANGWASGYSGYGVWGAGREAASIARAALTGPTTYTKRDTGSSDGVRWLLPSAENHIAHRARQKTSVAGLKSSGFQITTASERFSLPGLRPDKRWSTKSKVKNGQLGKAIAELGIKCRRRHFPQPENRGRRRRLGIIWLKLWDALCPAVQDLIIQRYKADPGIDNVQQALREHAASPTNRLIPSRFICLARFLSDGTPRLNRWLSTYMGADDTDLNRAQGRLVLTAAVRRVRRPGAKLNQIMVFEGPEGTGKSSAIALLAGEAKFSDQTILNVDDNQADGTVARRLAVRVFASLTDYRRARSTTLRHSPVGPRTRRRRRPRCRSARLSAAPPLRGVATATRAAVQIADRRSALLAGQDSRASRP